MVTIARCHQCGGWSQTDPHSRLRGRRRYPGLGAHRPAHNTTRGKHYITQAASSKWSHNRHSNYFWCFCPRVNYFTTILSYYILAHSSLPPFTFHHKRISVGTRNKRINIPECLMQMHIRICVMKTWGLSELDTHIKCIFSRPVSPVWPVMCAWHVTRVTTRQWLMMSWLTHCVMPRSRATLSGRTPGAILRYPLSGNIRAGDMLRPVHFEANNQPSKIFAWEIRI